MLGSVFVRNELTAGKAYPRSIAVLGGLDKCISVSELLLILEISFLVTALDRGNSLESARDLVKAFLLGSLGKLAVHLIPFKMLTVSGYLEVLFALLHTAEESKPDLRVFGFISRGFLKDDRSPLERMCGLVLT